MMCETPRPITDIDWSRLKTSCGYASHVPQAISESTSPDPSIRDRAYSSLDNYIVCQGYLYESAYYAIPFLMELVHFRNPHGREEAYELLSQIGLGFAEESCKTFDGRTIPLHRACRELVLNGTADYIRDVAEDSPESVKCHALDLLAILDESADVIIPALEVLAPAITHEDTKSKLHDTLLELRDRRDSRE